MDESENYLKAITLIFISLIIFIFIIFSLTSCTISFQNISTHGTATDLVDQDQSPTNDIKPNLVIPVNQGI